MISYKILLNGSVSVNTLTESKWHAHTTLEESLFIKGLFTE